MHASDLKTCVFSRKVDEALLFPTHASPRMVMMTNQYTRSRTRPHMHVLVTPLHLGPLLVEYFSSNDLDMLER